MKVSLFLALVMASSCLAQTAEIYRRNATEFARQKSWDQAIASYRKALELKPNDALTHYDLALALKYKGEAKQAADEFQAALRLKPKWAEAEYGLGAAFYDLRDLPAAAKELQSAVRLAPANAAAVEAATIAIHWAGPSGNPYIVAQKTAVTVL